MQKQQQKHKYAAAAYSALRQQLHQNAAQKLTSAVDSTHSRASSQCQGARQYMQRDASTTCKQELITRELGGVKDTPVVAERDYSLIDGYGMIVSHDGEIVTPLYTHLP